MEHLHVDISKGIDGEAVVFACFDLAEREISSSAHALAATVAERYRHPELSADQVLELRELTALADEFGELTGGMRTVVLRPARLATFHDALAKFVDTREYAEWIRQDDREPLAVIREMLWPLEQLRAEATRAALSPESATTD
jgi:hypothetical protein